MKRNQGMRNIDIFDKLTKPKKIMATFFLIAAVGFLNFLSGWEIDFSLFYIIPVAYSIWFLSFRAGVIACIVCTAVWLWVDFYLDHPYTSSFVHYWNSFIRVGFFFLFALILNSLRIAHEREKLLARIDGLTGTANSRYFYELLTLEIERAKRYNHPFCLAYMDLDNFKTVNDRFGHTTGDKALKKIADYVKINLRRADVLGRLGGDEFSLLFPETRQDGVRIVMSKLRKGLLQEMQQQGWPITFSIGVIICEDVYPDADDLIKTADELMYSVKNTSKNEIKFDRYQDRIV